MMNEVWDYAIMNEFMLTSEFVIIFVLYRCSLFIPIDDERDVLSWLSIMFCVDGILPPDPRTA